MEHKDKGIYTQVTNFNGIPEVPWGLESGSVGGGGDEIITNFVQSGLCGSDPFLMEFLSKDSTPTAFV